MLVPQSLVRTLLSEGMVLVSVDQTLVDDALGACLELITMFQDDPGKCSYTRAGEYEPEVGLVYRPGKNGSDHKYFFHYSHDLQFPVEATKQCGVLKKLYEMLGLLSLTIGQQLDDEYSELFSSPLAPNILQCLLQSLPYSTTTLRGLWYPNTVDRNGAKAHIDRSFITAHLGDEGGNLWAILNPDDEQGVPVSPPKGKALLFFGVKALHVSGGRLKPLRHRSTVEQDGDRKALVQFTHLDVNVLVSDAKKAHDAFYERV